MNERINKLAEQAGLNMWVNGNNELEFSENEKRFAELIVRECMKMCDEVHRDYGMASDTARISKRYIKKHFGVEE